MYQYRYQPEQKCLSQVPQISIQVLPENASSNESGANAPWSTHHKTKIKASGPTRRIELKLV